MGRVGRGRGGRMVAGERSKLGWVGVEIGYGRLIMVR